MDKFRILIVDDEPPARKKIRNFLQNEPVSRVFEAESGKDALRIIRDEHPDLVFLDIQMPGMAGFELIEAVGAESMPPVVFVTAYDQYALHAFEVQAVDYLLKPFDQGRFKKAFDRARRRVLSGSMGPEVFTTLLAEMRKVGRCSQRIPIRKGSRIFFIKTSEIHHITAEEKYVNIHTERGAWMLRETISRMESRLDPALFVRIHKSHIVNRDFIREIQPWTHGDMIVILKNGDQLRLSRRYRARVLGE